VVFRQTISLMKMYKYMGVAMVCIMCTQSC